MQCYAPMNDAKEEEKDKFYEQLLVMVWKGKKHDTFLALGDMNATVGSDNMWSKRVMGKFVAGEINDNGEKFADFVW